MCSSLFGSSSFTHRQSLAGANSDCIDDISDSEDEYSDGDGDHLTPSMARKRSSGVLLPEDDNRKYQPFTVSTYIQAIAYYIDIIPK